jgi:hypothetical protein
MIGKLRTLMADPLTTPDGPSVYTYKPDDLNDVPCFVVDRPSIAIDVQHWTVTGQIVVIGRRDGSADAQGELDELTAWAMGALAGPELAVQRVEPSTATVADHTYPSYTITVACGVTVCQN